MTTRAAIVADLRARLERDAFPRLTIAVILAFAGLVALLGSATALWAGLDSMGLRYALAVVIGCVALCVVYVVYMAPLLLAEVALDAALVSALYRRLRKEDVRHWTRAVVRHTWLPTAALLIFMSIAGFALQRVVPEARSIGDVFRAFVS